MASAHTRPWLPRGGFVNEVTSVYHQVPGASGLVTGAQGTAAVFSQARRIVEAKWPSDDGAVRDYRRWFKEFEHQRDERAALSRPIRDRIFEDVLRYIHPAFIAGAHSDQSVIPVLFETLFPPRIKRIRPSRPGEYSAQDRSGHRCGPIDGRPIRIRRRRDIDDKVLPHHPLPPVNCEYPGGLGVGDEDVSVRQRLASACHLAEERVRRCGLVLPNDLIRNRIYLDQAGSSETDAVVEDQDAPCRCGRRLMRSREPPRSPVPDDLAAVEVKSDDKVEAPQGEHHCALPP